MTNLGTILTWVFNFLLGVIGTALLASQISTGKSISMVNGKWDIHFGLQNMGLVLFIIFIAVYFWGAKKLWGKTIGGLLTAKILGKKK